MPSFISIRRGPSPSRVDPITAIFNSTLIEIIREETSKRIASMAPYRLHKRPRNTAGIKQAEEESLS